MNIKQFKEAAKNLGFSVSDFPGLDANVYKDYKEAAQSCLVLQVSNEKFGKINTYFDEFNRLPQNTTELYKLAVDYSMTPLKDRNDEPKFFVRLAPEDDEAPTCWLSKFGGGHWTHEVGKDSWFTPESYYDFVEKYPKWKPFLKKYDPDNKDVFVPLEA
ncbi:hypothetical protein IWT140_01737 [Secundilactobacillus pentosiphilus]|uniref:Uncharacterized protein n=1 Tax=Secundilactobacillus pentosiphilus TaxID=1714682 RepID=A0A1Z5IQU4_9LACO|nr:hypothetical protein [Secundilactobacillus pentosiphilus]GAX04100.1 hypothetical protein IWT140_01737 [Secundilactobacillus pentosiphilus]